MAKDKGFNPVQAQRKAEKSREIKKNKALVQTQRNERLARRNPERLQRQIDDLKAAEASGDLRPTDRQTLSQLEKDVAAIRKAREALGDKAPQFGRRDFREGDGGNRKPQRDDGPRSGILGKRRRDGSRLDEDSSGTDGDVQDIPMPRDTPPPIPRPTRKRDQRANEVEAADGERGPHLLPAKPAAPAPQAVYSAPSQLRNLQKEAVDRFVPAAVQRKLDQVKGKGKLLEPEELDKLEEQGYLVTKNSAASPSRANEESGNITTDLDRTLEEEESQFKMETKRVQIEEVEDEDL